MRLTRSRGARIGAVALAMVIVAEGAVWLLRPGEESPEPAPVSEDDYFTPGELERARDFRAGQRWLLVAGIGAQGALLVGLATGRPRRASRVLERLGARPVAGAAAAGAGLSVALAVVSLPPALWAHERSVDVGLSTQSLGPWLADLAKSTGISAVFAAAGAALLLAMVRRWPRGWWLPGAGAMVGIAVVFSWLAPVLLAPLFNDFAELPQGSRARAEVLELGRRGDVDIGEVLRVDASRRSTALNAYVGGLGPTKRVVLYDNLLERAETAELRSVVAHELGHVANDDIPRGIAFVALVAPLGLLFAREVGDAFARRSGAAPGSPAALPGLVLGIAVASFVLNVPGNQLSRQVEARADTYALRLTQEPQALIDLQQRLAVENVSDPDPPDAVTLLLGTHPTTLERIGAAAAFRDAGAASDEGTP